MNILQLIQRFEYYCTRHKILSHVAGEMKNRSFLECDIEEVQASLKAGVKYPCLLLLTPEVEKQGDGDSIMEHYEGSFWVLTPLFNRTKSIVYQECKDICDDIINHMIADAGDYFEGGMIKTAEGKVGPTSDQLYGWGVNFGYDQGYNGVMNPERWRAE